MLKLMALAAKGLQAAEPEVIPTTLMLLHVIGHGRERSVALHEALLAQGLLA